MIFCLCLMFLLVQISNNCLVTCILIFNSSHAPWILQTTLLFLFPVSANDLLQLGTIATANHHSIHIKRRQGHLHTAVSAHLVHWSPFIPPLLLGVCVVVKNCMFFKSSILTEQYGLCSSLALQPWKKQRWAQNLRCTYGTVHKGPSTRSWWYYRTAQNGDGCFWSDCWKCSQLPQPSTKVLHHSTHRAHENTDKRCPAHSPFFSPQ